MERAYVLGQVAVELRHIPWWPGKHQGMLRAIYQLLRANDLSAPCAKILHRSIAIVARDYPSDRVEYDREFFDG